MHERIEPAEVLREVCLHRLERFVARNVALDDVRTAEFLCKFLDFVPHALALIRQRERGTVFVEFTSDAGGDRPAIRNARNQGALSFDEFHLAYIPLRLAAPLSRCAGFAKCRLEGRLQERIPALLYCVNGPHPGGNEGRVGDEMSDEVRINLRRRLPEMLSDVVREA